MIHRRVDLETVPPSRVEVIGAVTRCRVYEPGSRLERDVVAEDELPFANDEWMGVCEVLESRTFVDLDRFPFGPAELLRHRFDELRGEQVVLSVVLDDGVLELGP